MSDGFDIRIQGRRLSKQDFAAVLAGGNSLKGKGLVLFLGEYSVRPGFGVVVPKRVMASACDRNRSKRILREWFRHNESNLQGQNCVIRITRPIVGKLGEQKLLSEIGRLLPK